MLQIAIVIIALAGMAHQVDPLWRPYLDVAMWMSGAMVIFALGDRFNTWLNRLAARDGGNEDDLLTVHPVDHLHDGFIVDGLHWLAAGIAAVFRRLEYR